jgi:hypothetical protein
MAFIHRFDKAHNIELLMKINKKIMLHFYGIYIIFYVFWKFILLSRNYLSEQENGTRKQKRKRN